MPSIKVQVSILIYGSKGKNFQILRTSIIIIQIIIISKSKAIQILQLGQNLKILGLKKSSICRHIGRLQVQKLTIIFLKSKTNYCNIPFVQYPHLKNLVNWVGAGGKIPTLLYPAFLTYVVELSFLVSKSTHLSLSSVQIL